MATLSKRKISLAALVIALFFIVAGFLEVLEARSAGGGRSFGSRPSVSRPSSAPRQSTMGQQTTRSPFSNPMGGSFMRGLAGGVMGGMLGSMLFGGAAHGMGMGGLGGSGFGLFEILILAGIGYFLYRRFTRTRAYSPSPATDPSQNQNPVNRLFSGLGGQVQPPPPPQPYENPDEDPLVAGVRQIWAVDGEFHPDTFKETAQDLFFKVQAGWTRRETEVLKDLVGDQLLAEYGQRFAEMKHIGHINRLENIAVRKIDLVNAGVQEGEIFVTVKFTANLLDYTVDEKTDAVVKGDRENPVKFEEDWTFASPVGARRWKLEGIEAY
jgi:predicted lipid-binding transport protein (Tim44 family)